MKYVVLGFVLTLGLSPPVVLGQEVLSPFRVSEVRINPTAITNWVPIELTYTIGYVDGYEPIYDEMKPSNMQFGPMYLDPMFSADKVDLRNSRRSDFFKENFFDLVYHLRYAGEKKQELIIPPQVFSYRRVSPNKQQIDASNFVFKTPEFRIRYDSLLTSDVSAYDIKDTIDFGSFYKESRLYHVGAISLFMLIFVSAGLLIFKKSVYVFSNVTDGKMPRTSDKSSRINYLADLGGVASRLGLLFQEDTIDVNKFYALAVDLKNACRGVIQLYIPLSNDALTSIELQREVLKIDFCWLRVKLVELFNIYKSCEDYLYNVDATGVRQPTSQQESSFHIFYSAARYQAVALSPAKVLWHNRLWRLQLLCEPIWRVISKWRR